MGGGVEPGLLGGWRDVAEDVRQLERALRAPPDTCTCGHGSTHLAGACPCCRAGTHALDDGCTDCETLLASLHNRMEALVDAALRYLPALDVIVSGRDRIEPASLADLRWQILHIVVHDPQPAALLGLHGKAAARWIWRCHIDTGSPNPETWQLLRPFLDGYDAAVFTMAAFVPPDLPIERRAVIPPAIDPLSPKNMELDEALTDRVRSAGSIPGKTPWA